MVRREGPVIQLVSFEVNFLPLAGKLRNEHAPFQSLFLGVPLEEKDREVAINWRLFYLKSYKLVLMLFFCFKMHLGLHQLLICKLTISELRTIILCILEFEYDFILYVI